MKITKENFGEKKAQRVRERLVERENEKEREWSGSKREVKIFVWCQNKRKGWIKDEGLLQLGKKEMEGERERESKGMGYGATNLGKEKKQAEFFFFKLF